jgi:hypothetical protein
VRRAAGCLEGLSSELRRAYGVRGIYQAPDEDQQNAENQYTANRRKQRTHACVEDLYAVPDLVGLGSANAWG